MALILPNAQPGLWHITIGNIRGGEGYQLNEYHDLPTPVVTVARPAAGQQLTANPSVTLAGTLADAGRYHTVSLYYTDQPAVRLNGQVIPNFGGGTPIATGVPVVGGRWQYRWDTNAVPGGVYHVYAVLENGIEQAVQAYAPGTVRVSQPARPNPPRDAVATEQNGRLTVAFAPPARSALVAGYHLRFRDNSMPAGRYYTLNLGALTGFVINETRPGAHYTATVSAYDVDGHESRGVAARLVHLKPGQNPGAHAPDFRLVGGRAAARGGGVVVIPLALRPLGRASGTGADFVTLGVSGLPAGVLAVPTTANANLFAQGAGAAVPGLRVQTAATLRPGTYPLRVTARQAGSGRVRTGVATLVIRAGDPSLVVVRAGRVTTRPDRLRSVPVEARVTDASGAPVTDGTQVTFSAPNAVLAATTVRTVGGVARTTLVYVPGAHPVIIADAFAAAASLYLGPTPWGAATRRYFAAVSGLPAAHRGGAVVHEDLVLRNPLPATAQARVTLRFAAPLGTVERTLRLPIAAATTVTERLDVLARTAAPGYPLVGVEVRSDLPLYSQRVRYAVTTTVVRTGHGRRMVTRTREIGRTGGVDAPRQAYRLRLASGRTVLDLYNPSARPVAVTLVTQRTGGGSRPSSTTRLRLATGGSARVNVGVRSIARIVTRRVIGRDRKGRRVVHLAPTRTVVIIPLAGRGPLTVTVSAAAPVVVEVEP